METRTLPSSPSADSPEDHERRRAIVQKALAVGFSRVGFAPARLDSTEARRFNGWLHKGYHGEMHWMARRPERRVDAGQILPEAQTLVCCALDYYQGPPAQPSSLDGVIASYARGDDYHRTLETRLREVARFIESEFEVETRLYVDTGPVLEKSYAVAAGLGWLGKHSNILSREGSSWFFLGEILVPLSLPLDAPVTSHCGTCTRCIEACPTGAIVEPYVVDSRLCISYLTIELRGFIPRELRPLVGNRIFGCDDCQDVCPWNRFAKKSDERAFFPREPLGSMDLIQMLRMSREEFQQATRRSAIRRSRYPGFLRNVAVALGNSGDRRAVPPLTEALDHDEALVRGHVAWALGHLQAQEAAPPLRRRLSVELDEDVRREIRWALNQLGS